MKKVAPVETIQLNDEDLGRLFGNSKVEQTVETAKKETKPELKKAAVSDANG